VRAAIVRPAMGHGVRHRSERFFIHDRAW
jgi:hypothetical protein